MKWTLPLADINPQEVVATKITSRKGPKILEAVAIFAWKLRLMREAHGVVASIQECVFCKYHELVTATSMRRPPRLSV